jgi:hypothetical protein
VLSRTIQDRDRSERNRYWGWFYRSDDRGEPSRIFADAHTTMFSLGVVRGQLKDC